MPYTTPSKVSDIIDRFTAYFLKEPSTRIQNMLKELNKIKEDDPDKIHKIVRIIDSVPRFIRPEHHGVGSPMLLELTKWHPEANESDLDNLDTLMMRLYDKSKQNEPVALDPDFVRQRCQLFVAAFNDSKNTGFKSIVNFMKKQLQEGRFDLKTIEAIDKKIQAVGSHNMSWIPDDEVGIFYTMILACSQTHNADKMTFLFKPTLPDFLEHVKPPVTVSDELKKAVNQLQYAPQDDETAAQRRLRIFRKFCHEFELKFSKTKDPNVKRILKLIREVKNTEAMPADNYLSFKQQLKACFITKIGNNPEVQTLYSRLIGSNDPDLQSIELDLTVKQREQGYLQQLVDEFKATLPNKSATGIRQMLKFMQKTMKDPFFTLAEKITLIEDNMRTVAKLRLQKSPRTRSKAVNHLYTKLSQKNSMGILKTYRKGNEPNEDETPDPDFVRQRCQLFVEQFKGIKNAGIRSIMNFMKEQLQEGRFDLEAIEAIDQKMRAVATRYRKEPDDHGGGLYRAILSTPETHDDGKNRTFLFEPKQPDILNKQLPVQASDELKKAVNPLQYAAQDDETADQRRLRILRKFCYEFEQKFSQMKVRGVKDMLKIIQKHKNTKAITAEQYLAFTQNLRNCAHGKTGNNPEVNNLYKTLNAMNPDDLQSIELDLNVKQREQGYLQQLVDEFKATLESKSATGIKQMLNFMQKTMKDPFFTLAQKIVLIEDNMRNIANLRLLKSPSTRSTAVATLYQQLSKTDSKGLTMTFWKKAEEKQDNSDEDTPPKSPKIKSR